MYLLSFCVFAAVIGALWIFSVFLNGATVSVLTTLLLFCDIVIAVAVVFSCKQNFHLYNK